MDELRCFELANSSTLGARQTDCPRMPRQSTPKAPIRWSILILRSKAVWLGDVEAASEAEAIAKGAEAIGQPKERLMAVRR
jgi:hypothetical protein